MPRSHDLLNKVVHLCKTLGFVLESRVKSDGFPIYFYNYGPFGVQTKRNIQNEWWHEIVTSRDNIHGLELSTLQHLDLEGEKFDNCKSSLGLGFLVLRRDQLEKRITELVSSKPKSNHVEDTMPGVSTEVEDVLFSCRSFLREDCNFGSLEHFSNLAGSCASLNVSQVPFGIAQCGKFFRSSADEKFLFRSPEQELLSLQFLCHENKSYQWQNYWRRHRLIWWKKFANTPSDFSLSDQMSSDNSGANFKTEILYKFPWGKESVETIQHKTNISKMATLEKHNDEQWASTNTSQLHLIQMTASLDRGFLAFLLDAYHEKEQSAPDGETRLNRVLALHPSIAPVKVAVIMCDTEKVEVQDVAQQLASELRTAGIKATYVQCENLETRFISHDETGTPYCVTIHDNTLMDGFVTLRNRDTTLEEFLHISELVRTVQTMMLA